jgi:pyruvate/2-oxoglutarate dehydrogenase complex dihydrolipoamide acyltransferase (E2) component
MSMQEGTLIGWLVADGDLVVEGQPLYVLETDKVENEIPCPASGTVRLIGEAGISYPVGTDIAEIHPPT